MYGWRARLGLVIPANNTVIEPEFARMVPDGIATFGAKILSHGLSADGIERMVANSHRAVDELAAGDMSAFAYACLATSLVKGDAWTSEFQAHVEDKTGKPVTTAATATLEALQSLGTKRVALATPYPKTINDLLPALFDRAGIEVVSLKSVAVKDSLEVCRLDPSVAYRLAKEADTDRADAVCILATDIRSIDVLETLEADLGKPAISTNQALLWRCLKFCDIGDPVNGFGSLLKRISA
jgi:maleate cis-trans isomerase